MFGNQNKEEKTEQPVNGGNTVNILGEGTSIEGDVKTDSDIRIDGNIKGTIDSQAKIVVGKSGKIEGDISCINADISGTITGELRVQEMLFLKSSAVIEGDITAIKLVVEAGAQFNGNCQMGTKEVRQSNESGSGKKEKQQGNASLKKEAS
ncbi:MAG: cell shape determination protein CcmA [Bacteroidetes bacterium SW_11_45_7]|nr:MAG: cell shape determination protein CcmA [Bacteroidetes bacterium SW_11_45_7]